MCTALMTVRGRTLTHPDLPFNIDVATLLTACLLFASAILRIFELANTTAKTFILLTFIYWRRPRNSSRQQQIARRRIVHKKE